MNCYFSGPPIYLVALRDVEALLLLEQLHDRPNGPTGQVGLGCGRLNLGQQQLIELDPQLTKQDGHARRRLKLHPTINGDRLLRVAHLTGEMVWAPS